jgi:hypothetical protein
MFEHRKEPLLPRLGFVIRFVRSSLIAIGAVVVAWAIGAAGYHHLAGLPWIDAIYNAAMILAGMGPAAELHDSAAKMFASVYALMSGFLFLTVADILFAPLLHRMMHRFHLETDLEEPAK